MLPGHEGGQQHHDQRGHEQCGEPEQPGVARYRQQHVPPPGTLSERCADHARTCPLLVRRRHSSTGVMQARVTINRTHAIAQA